MIKKNLKKLAILKIKADSFKKYYDQLISELKEELLNDPDKKCIDSDNDLMLCLTTQYPRSFNVGAAYRILGSDFLSCVDVNARKFDAIVKSKQLPIELINQCFAKIEKHILCWEGLKILESKIKEDQDGRD